MISYLIIVFLFLFLDRFKRVSPFVKYCILAYIAVFMCAGYMCGSDWRSYETKYLTYRLDDMLEEPGFPCLSITARNIGLSFWPFVIAVKFLCLLAFYKYIKQYATDSNLYLALLFFFSFYGIYLLIDAPMRNLCAIAIFLWGLLLEKKNKWYPWFLSLIAIGFHVSAVVGILYLVLRNYRISSWIYLGAYIVAVIISLKSDYINDNAGNTLIGQILFADKIERYIENGFGGESVASSALSLGEILKIFLFFVVLLCRKYIERLNNGVLIFTGAMFFFIIAKMGAAIDVLMRFGCFFAVYYALALCYASEAFFKPYKKMFRTCVVLLAVLQTCLTVRVDYRFVPYTNYFEYLLFHDNMPSYNYRSDYNFKNTPYKE